ncbi:AMP-binding protein, partial [Dyadobacter sp. OTU695]|uniref:AMP-binding protein n=1 Tax=Dyadobacter sp. OTU695 TaxID=3043860 RepID=UPI00313DF71B
QQSLTYGFGDNERVLQFSNYSFDASVEQIFLSLINGGALVLIPQVSGLDISLIERVVDDERVTHLDVTPSFLENLTVGKYAALKRVVCGGEICRKQLAQRWDGHVEFFNVYGPTEATISSASYKFLSNVDAEILPIGAPIGNTRIYILDGSGGLCPVGVAGELYIGGSGVARG